MSAYEVSIDHIAFLVNLGRQLAIGGVVVGHAYQPLHLDDDCDRVDVAARLLAANRASAGTGHDDIASTDAPSPAVAVATAPTPLRTVAECVQALQWVRCYRYQSCEHPDWPTSFAAQYTERLRSELETRIIGFFDTTWDYEPVSRSRPNRPSEGAQSARP